MYFLSVFFRKTRLLLLSIFFVLLMSGAVFGTISGINNCGFITPVTVPTVGTQVTISVQFNSNTTANNNQVAVTAFIPGAMNGPANLVANKTGSLVTANGNIQIQQGTLAYSTATCWFTVTDGDNNTSSLSRATSFYIDNVNPTRNGMMTATVAGSTYGGQQIKSGQKIVLTQQTNGANVETITLNIPNLNINNVAMTKSGTTFTYTIDSVPINLEGAFPCNITMVSIAGLRTNYQGADNTLVLNVDSRSPTIQNATVTNTSGNPVARPNNILSFSCTITNYDNDTVTVNCTELKNKGLSFPLTLDYQGGNNFSKTFVLPKNNSVYYNNMSFTFTAKDDVGNTASTDVIYADIIDLSEFEHKNAKIEIYSEHLKKASVATSTSLLYFETEVITGKTDLTTVSVDLAEIGGPVDFPLIYSGSGNKYIGTYTAGITTQIDGRYVNFKITAKDQYETVIDRYTTPAILIDNVPPVIQSFTVTGNTGMAGTIIHKDRISIDAVISGANATSNAVSVDLSRMDNTGVHYLTRTSENNWTYKHTVQKYHYDDFFDFVLVAKDINGNKAESTANMLVDNEPPEYISKSNTIPVQQNPPYIIIGDSITTKVKVNNLEDEVYARIDLSALGNYGVMEMSNDGIDEFNYSFEIATGSINNGANFYVTIMDNAGNKAVNSGTDTISNIYFSFPNLDQNPPDPDMPEITLQNHTDTDDKYPEYANIKKTITFTLPYTRETNNEDSATATLDVTYLPKLKDGSMQYLDSNLNKLSLPTISNLINLTKSATNYTTTIVATSSPGLAEKSLYQFIFTMYDKSGNRTRIESYSVPQVDFSPPVLSSLVVGTSGRDPLIIGDTVSFKAYVSQNDDVAPTIDLTTLNPELGLVTLEKESTGVYSYNATIGTGTFNNINASWAVTIYDGKDNSITSYTRQIKIDNKPPEPQSFLATADNITLNQRLNYTENYTEPVTIELTSAEQLTVTFDLSAIGGDKKQVPTETDLGGSWKYSYTAYTAQTSEEFEDYKFPATIRDSNGNIATVYTQAVRTVDCEVPIINETLCGIEIKERNPDLSSPKNENIVRIGDTITVYASMSAALDATATIELGIDPDVATLTYEMTYNRTTKRLEKDIVIKSSNVVENGAKWGRINKENLAYIISASDDAGNIATPTAGVTSFAVKNIYPTIASYSLTILPDIEAVGIFNVASGTNRATWDVLVASATLADGAIIATASLDFSNIGWDSKYYLASITNSIANNTGTGIDIASFTKVDYLNVPIPITIYDEAGYPCGESASLEIDTKIPEITNVTYNGEKLVVVFSETVKDIAKYQWTLLGSASVPIGANAKLNLSETSELVESWTEYFEEVEIELSTKGKKEVANWASAPIYLEVKRDSDIAAAKDLYENWIASYAAYPITITDYSSRETPTILNFAMTRDWPNKIYFDIKFSAEMDPDTLVASDAVIFIDIPAGRTEFNDVTYDSWYVIQKEDTCQWIDGKDLRITLGDNGRDWIATKLTNNLRRTLKFAQKSSANRMIKNIYDKELELYTISSPIIISDNREVNPLPALNIYSDPQPIINLSASTLTLYFTDRVLLFSDEFETVNETDPLMKMPTPTNKNGASYHLNNITLFNLENNQTISLECASITAELNDYASSTVRIVLTESDIEKILDYYNTASTINWALKVNAGSFFDLWGNTNTQYKPNNPGTVEIVESVPTENATLIAVSVSDMPPTKDSVGNFTFDFELNKEKADEITVPFSTISSPTAGIFEISTGDRIASATVYSWSTRLVRNVERTIVTFKTSEEFTKDVDGVPAELRIYGLKDIFEYENPVLIASYVYDRNMRSSTNETGFATASAAFIIDNVAPLATVTPILLGNTPVGKDKFEVEYSEEMDTNFVPSLTLATGSTVISLTLNRWENNNTKAVFTNNQAITTETMNGTWTYILSGGQDLAGNPYVTSNTEVLLLSKAPKIVSGSMHLNTIRKNIDNNTVVVDKPLNFEASPDYTKITFKYLNTNIENLPHTLCFYNSADEQIGSAPIVHNGVNATATFNVGDFSYVPTTNTYIKVKIIDNAENLTGEIGRINYFATAPEVNDMTLYGVATLSQGIYYYTTVYSDMVFVGNLNGTINNPLNLLIASSTDVATMTVNNDYVYDNVYRCIFGTSLKENTYKIYVADDAGNLHILAEPLTLVVDNTQPTVESIIPGPDDLTGNTKIGMATFSVKFNELMDTTRDAMLILATSTRNVTIDMKFMGWNEDRMTASFTNSVNIVSTFPVGIYRYYVSYARDLAGNEIWETPATCTTYIHPEGPGVIDFTILTLQPDISGVDVLENRDFNPTKYNTGDAASVTIKLDYVSGPFNTPHQLLVYDSNDENIATFAVTVGNPGYVTWNAGDIPAGNNTYHFNIIDTLGNYGSEDGYLSWTFSTDTTVPEITSIDFDDGEIGQIYDGIKYYSPSIPATFSITTDETTDLVLIASSTATSTYLIPATSSFIISFGNDLNNGTNTINISDLAGNINTAASITLMVDNVEPLVSSAQAVDEIDNVLTTIGKDARILVEFNEIMNINTATPIVLLATDTGEVATLTFDTWDGYQKCYFITNGVFDTTDFPVGTASIIVSGARDLAGNFIATATYGNVEVISKSPEFEVKLTSQQSLINDNSLENIPLSLRVIPNVATMTIQYNKGPYALNHILKLFDGTETQIATQTITTVIDGISELTVDSDFFGDISAAIAAPNEYSGTFTVKITDAVNNTATDTNNFVLIYDSVSPKVSSFTLTDISSASTELIYYYNPDLTGSLTANVNLTASDSIRLIAFGIASSTGDVIATRTYDMDKSSDYKYSYNGVLINDLNEDLPEGTYCIEAVDLAGNLSVLSSDNAIEASATLIIDKTIPNILVATLSDEIYLSSGEAGMATFTIQFDETLFDKGYQYLELATDSYKIVCRLVDITTTTIASDTAIFETAVAVENLIPQGPYVYHIIGTDLTGNRNETDFGEILVKSGGPQISSINTFSYQQTTASATLESGEEYHYNEVFSFNVEPNAATMSIILAEEPDGATTTIYLNFLKKITVDQLPQEVFVASYPLTIDENLMATFTWDALTEPTVATSANYLIRLSDINGDYSYKSYEWLVDCEIPTYTSMLINGGVNFTASEVVYLNPYRHTNFEVTFKNLIDMNPRLRVRSEVSTDTYPLTSISGNSWKTSFRGKYSRDTGNPDDLMPDGVYYLGLVDQAGNTAASDTEDLYKLIIDTLSPEITSYTLKINGINVTTYCAPSEAHPLTIALDTTEPLTATGAYYLDIYNIGGTRINRLGLNDNGGTLEAYWNGQNANNETAADGVYTFRVADICGNASENIASTTAVTSPFRVMPPAVQTASTTVKIWLNHSIEPSSLGLTPIVCEPAIELSDIHIEDDRALAFIAKNMDDGASYTFTITSSLSNIYGSTITSNTAILYADVRGPAITGTSFENVNSQNEVLVLFDQQLEQTSAQTPSSYIVQDASGNIIPIVSAILQSDNSSVMLCASYTFIENAYYTIKAPGVTDELGNIGCGTSVAGISFQGRDVTPPSFTISAFSNAGNENDIIVVVISNEELIEVPTLTILHGYASPITMTMQKSTASNLAYMAAASLKASNGQSGTLKVEGEDLNRNKGSNTASFAIATAKPNTNLKLSSKDDNFTLIVDEKSLKSEATIKILQRPIVKDETATGTIQTQLQKEYASIRGVTAVTTEEEEANNSELTPLTDAYEASINSSKVNKGIIASMKVPETASQTSGIGLFYQKNGSWNFISANITTDKKIKARITSNKVFAIMRDNVAPSIKLDDSMDLSKKFETARPEFLGNIKDYGSGLDTNAIEAKIDNFNQKISLDTDGSFKFKPLSELINGNHELTITAKDRTGNIASTGNMRFVLVLPFEFKQIIQYPNPARNNVTIRIRTNSTGINCNIRIKIYDVAGHKVADFDESDVLDKNDGNYEVRWDLRNKKGKKVANGTYIAKLEAINPETGKKVKSTLKIAVLK